MTRRSATHFATGRISAWWRFPSVNHFAVQVAHDLGLRHFGESQIQEGVPKIKAAPKDIHWHFVGHLQKNKVRACVKHFQYIHSVDSVKLLQRINQIAGEERFRPEVFLQVNLAMDPDKHGMTAESVAVVLKEALGCAHLSCIGLTGIPPLDLGEGETLGFFKDLANLRSTLRSENPEWPGRLSMGMSRDFEWAIAAGANYVRIGTEIFGERLA